MLVLSRHEVEDLLDIGALIETLAKAMVHLSSGEVEMAPRTIVAVRPQNGMLASMLSYTAPSEWLASKLVGIFPQNVERQLPTHQAVVTVFDSQNGTPVAVMDGTYITEVRTAAGSALATRLLSREDSRVMAVFGTGVQARSHSRIVSRVRKLEQIRVAGRDPAKARSLAEELNGELEVAVRPSDSLDAAAEGADIICAATHSPEPVVTPARVAPGMHINSVGVNPDGREVDALVVKDSFVVVEALAAALASPGAAGANDLMWAIRDGVIPESHVRTEIGQILGGDVKGRTSDDQITLYKSVGVAVQDAAAASLVLEAARARGVGTEVEL